MIEGGGLRGCKVGFRDEHKAFVSKLIRNPLFAIRHALAFRELISGKFVQNFLIRVRGRHKGTKAWPVWLPRTGLGPAKDRDWKGILNAIPERRRTSPLMAIEKTESGLQFFSEGADDLEDYLKANRWGSLLHDDLSEEGNIRKKVDYFS